MISSPMDGPSSLDIMAIYPDVPINMTEGRSELDLFKIGTFSTDNLNDIDDGLGYFMKAVNSAYMLFRGVRNLESLSEDLVIRSYHGDDWLVHVKGYMGQNILRTTNGRPDLLLNYYCVPSVLREDLRCVDPLSGKEYWSFPLPSMGDPQGRLVLNGDMDGIEGDEIIVMDFGPSGMTLTRLDAEDGTVLWSTYHDGIETWPRSKSDVIRYDHDYFTDLDPQFVSLKDRSGTSYIIPDKFNRMMIDIDDGNISQIISDSYHFVSMSIYHGSKGDLLVRYIVNTEWGLHTEIFEPFSNTVISAAEGYLYPFQHEGSDFVLNSHGSINTVFSLYTGQKIAGYDVGYLHQPDLVRDFDHDGDIEGIFVRLGGSKGSDRLSLVDLFNGTIERSTDCHRLFTILLDDEKLILNDYESITIYRIPDLVRLITTSGLYRGSSFDWNGNGIKDIVIKDIVTSNETAYMVIEGTTGEILATFDPFGEYLHAMTDLDKDGKKELLFTISGSAVAVEDGTREKFIVDEMLKEDIPGEWAGNWICKKGDYKNDLGDYFIQKKEGIEYVTNEDFISLKSEREMITDEMEVRFNLDTWLLKKAIQDRDITIDTGPHGSLAKGLLRLNNSFGSFVFKPDQGYEGPCSISVRVNVTPEVAITRSASVYVMKSPIAPNVTIPHEEWFEPQDLRPMEHAFLKVKLDAGYFDHWIKAMIEDPSDIDVVEMGRDDMTWSFSFIVPGQTDQLRLRIDIVKGGSVVSSTWIQKNITQSTDQIVAEGNISLETPEQGEYAIIGTAMRVIVRYSGDPLVGEVRFRCDDGSTPGYIVNAQKIGKDTWFFFHIVPDMGYFTLKVTLLCGGASISESSRFFIAIGGIEAITSEDIPEQVTGYSPVIMGSPMGTDDGIVFLEEDAGRPAPEKAKERDDGAGTMVLLVLTALSILGAGYVIYFSANFINGRRKTQ
jgi:hypothetical protein